MGHPPDMPLMPKPDMYHGSGASPMLRGRMPPARFILNYIYVVITTFK